MANPLDALLNTKDGMDTTQRNGTKQDDGTDTFLGVDWWKFAGVAASNIYINGNNWVGFGTNGAQLNVCNRDGATWYVYRQEGVLFGWRFLKIRVVSCSHYNNTAEEYTMWYEIFLLENGNMFLNVQKAPTNTSYLGTSSLVCAGVTTPLTIKAPTQISFYALDDTGSSWDVRYEKIVILPASARYLVRAGDALYTVSSGELVPLEASEVTAALFQTSGAEVIPPGELLRSLTDPQVLYWHDIDIDPPALLATVEGTPFPQLVITGAFAMDDETINGIASVEAVCTDDVLFAFCFDIPGNVWLAHNGTAWGTVTEDNAGMSRAQMAQISVDAWAEAATTGQYKLRFYLLGTDSAVTSATVHYLN